MVSLPREKWHEVRVEWSELERHERIHVVWEFGNLAATILLPILLLFTFILAAPGLPSVDILLVLVGVGIIYGGSVMFQGPILDYIDPDDN